MTPVLEQYPVSMILPSENDTDSFYIATEIMPLRKKDPKRHLILEVEIKGVKVEPTQAPIG